MRREEAGKLASLFVCILLSIALFSGLKIILNFPTVVDASGIWLDAIQLNNIGGTCKEPKVAVEGDNVHAVWANSDNGKVYYKRSLDNGWTWGNDIELASGSNPRIEVWGNNVHLLWNNGYKKSIDNGDTWGSAIDIFSGLYQTVCYDLALYSNNVYVAVVEREGSSWPYNHYLQFKKSTTNGDSWGSWITLDGPTWDEMMEVAITTKGNDIHIIIGLSPFDHDAFIRWFNHTYSQSGGTSWSPSYKINTGGMQKAGLSISYSGSSVSMVWIELADLETIQKGWAGGWFFNNILGYGDGWFTAASENYIVWGSTWSGPNTIYSNLDGILNSIEGYEGDRAFFDVSKENEDVHYVYIDNYQVYYKHKGNWPELLITSSDIQFNPLSPVENGTSLYINATVYNSGVSAQNVEVKFYNGDPDTDEDLIQDPSATEIGSNIVNISQDSSELASIQWIPPAIGTYNIYIWVDASNNIQEYNDSNNLANKTLEIIPGVFTMELIEGWNLISIPLELSENNLTTVLESIEGHYDAVQWFNSNSQKDFWKHFHVTKPSNLNDLQIIDQKMGLWLHITDSGGTTLTVIDNKLETFQSISLYQGWNLVGYPSSSTNNGTDALNNLVFGNEIDSIWTFNATSQEWEELSESDYFELGRGYWIHAKTNCVWNVPL